jgi:phosphate acetyltransferase
MRESHHVFEHLIAQCRDLEPIAVAVAFPDDDVSLLGALEAARQHLIVPVLVGPRSRILAVAQSIGQDLSAYRIVDVDSAEAAAAQAVALCRRAECAALMKGSLHTDVLMHEVMKADTGLRGAGRVSHVFVMDVPNYPKLLLITDAAINIAPSLEEKAAIVQNAIELAQVLGIVQPKVAILSAVETVTPKIASTIDAAALCKMADRGQIQGGIVDGPLAFDNAVSLRAARIKHIVSPVAGQADILVVPDLESGNMLAKQLEYLADAEAAGIVLGARVPIVLTSRADSAKARLASCAVMAMLVHARRKGGTAQGTVGSTP